MHFEGRANSLAGSSGVGQEREPLSSSPLKVRLVVCEGGGDVMVGIDRCTLILINPVTNGLDSIFLVKLFQSLVLFVTFIDCGPSISKSQMVSWKGTLRSNKPVCPTVWGRALVLGQEISGDI